MIFLREGLQRKARSGEATALAGLAAKSLTRRRRGTPKLAVDDFHWIPNSFGN